MIQLIIWLCIFPFYFTYWMLKILWCVIVIIFYILKLIISTIINIKQNMSTKVCYNNVVYNAPENKTQIVENEKKYTDCKNYKEYSIAEPTDIEYSMIVAKIQDLYEKYGFVVKVTDIKKNKYNTEYEVIFERKYSQDQLLAISSNILEEFVIDGTNIKPNQKEKNRISVIIPLEYRETGKSPIEKGL